MGVKEGLVALQLKKWTQLPFRPNLQEFDEAVISPSKELLLLISHECEALLLPLTGKKSLESGKSNKCKSERLCNPAFLHFSSPEVGKTSSSESLLNATPGADPFENSSIDTLLLQCSVICNVKTLAWGHFGDLYDNHEETSFRELLVVSNANDIVVHVFLYPGGNDELFNSSSENGAVHGDWVEWGPSGRKSNGSSFVDSNVSAYIRGEDGTGRQSQSLCHSGSVTGIYSQDLNPTKKKWLRSYLIEPEVLASESGYLLHFPKRLSLPPSANVVSFSIYHTLLMFMKAVFYRDSLCKAEYPPGDRARAFMEYLNSAGQHAGPDFSGKASNPQTNTSHGREVEISCQCSRVFGGSSHHLIGLVVEWLDNTDNNGEHRGSAKIFVIVIMVHRWGIRWLSCADLHTLCRDEGIQAEWVDFQFSNNLLVCLNSSGLICICDAEVGDSVARIHVLEGCGLYSKLSDTCKSTFPKGDGVKQESDIMTRKTHVESHSDVRKCFRKLVISSYSMLMAAIDECGLIYIICAEECLPAKHRSMEPFSRFQDVLFGWKIAGNGIGNQKMPFDFLGGSGSASQIGEKSRHVQYLGCKPSSCLRKVLMPVDGPHEKVSYFFSPLGLACFARIPGEAKHKVVHTCLHISSAADERDLMPDNLLQKSACFWKESLFPGDAIGCYFKGSLYLVTQDGLSVVIPAVKLGSDNALAQSIRCWKSSTACIAWNYIELGDKNELNKLLSPWQVEIIDRIILYEGPEEAEAVCLENGWDLKVARIRRLQLALHYLNCEEVQRSLEVLADVDLAEEGILRLIFASFHQIICLAGRDDDGTLPTRFLSLAASFATKMIHRYGLVEYEKININGGYNHDISELHQEVPTSRLHNLRKLKEMALFLETIRNMQCRLGLKEGRSSQVDQIVSVEFSSSHGEPSLSQDSKDVTSVDSMHLTSGAKKTLPKEDSNLALLPVEFPVEERHELLAYDTGNVNLESENISRENAKDMMTRWVVDDSDLRAVVKDALLTGHLPLAVHRLHLQHLKDLDPVEESCDTFSIVRNVGRTIAYGMFLEGKIELAITTLQRLGESVEVSLRQLLFGTVRRSLRGQIAEKMKKLGYLKSNELRTLESLSMIERAYPENSFWGTYTKKHGKSTSSSETELNSSQMCLKLCKDFSIECGDIDGAVLDPWASVIAENSSVPEAGVINTDGYWESAAVWSDAWDGKTINRVILDQCKHSEIKVLWESQLEYHVSRSEWRDIEMLLDDVPTSLLSEGSLKINIERLYTNDSAISGKGIMDNDNLICLSKELYPVPLEIPNLKIFRFSICNISSSWMKMLIEQKLASSLIFLRDVWGSTSEILPLLARSGAFLSRPIEFLEAFNVTTDTHLSHIVRASDTDTCTAFHKLVICYCIQYGLPILMELYLDHHGILLDKNSLSSILEITGDCQWANWLLLSRNRGCEYDASFANARCIFSENMAPARNLNIPDSEEILLTVDDMAEGGGELAALATLMYAPCPVQDCLCRGSVSSHGGAFQCTLENLKHSLQQFPTLWNTLVAFSFGEDPYSLLSSTRAKNAFVSSATTDYLTWRDAIFSSSGGDTSLIQMVPCWFPKSIRRLVKIFVQGPPRWESLSGDIGAEDSFEGAAPRSSREAGSSAVSWEAAIQRSLEELYSSLQEKTIGIEHHLHRGRPLAAFNLLLGLRARELRSNHSYQVEGGCPTLGQPDSQEGSQSDIQALLGPLMPNERLQLSRVMPLAIMHFEDSVLVASCAFLLELCGLSANMLRLDVAVLERISSYYKSAKRSSPFGQVSPKARFHSVATEDIAVSLSRTLAEIYSRLEGLYYLENDNVAATEAPKFSSWNLMNVLQHLEKASLPLINDGDTCGSWLASGIGDGIELRSQQKAASHYWHLVSLFCQMHHLSLSTKYLAVLAKDNDWVGFLEEAQITRFPIDTVIQVADKEFSDPRLKMHILTVLKSIQSLRCVPVPKGSDLTGTAEVLFTGSNDMYTTELFGIVSECERKKKPGEALLLKARDLRWSLLALVASCFPDISPVSCLTIWLEISVARETSSIKINDVYSKIASNVGAAVVATNKLPFCSRTLKFHYNRKNPKRRQRIDDSSAEDAAKFKTFTETGRPGSAKPCFTTDFMYEAGGTIEVAAQSTHIGDTEENLEKLSNMISILCEQHLFLPLLKAFELFLPSCSLLPFIRSLQAFSQMRLSDASTHLTTFSNTIKETSVHTNSNKQEHLTASWIGTASVKAANAMLGTCPSTYEKRSLLLLLSSVDFHDGGSAASYFLRLYWKINLAEPLVQGGGDLPLGAESLDDDSLLEALTKSGQWEQARNWAKLLDTSDAPLKHYAHHVTEMQAEAMVTEWKEFLWDVPEERAAIWSHCQTLFVRHSFPALQAGKFFLEHAEAIENEIPAKELHELLLLSLQWLSGFISQTNSVFPLHMLRDIETRVWLLAVESDVQYEAERDFPLLGSLQNPIPGSKSSAIERTANIISKMDNHINNLIVQSGGRSGTRESIQPQSRPLDSDSSSSFPTGTGPRRRSKSHKPPRQFFLNVAENNNDNDDYSSQPYSYKNNGDASKSLGKQDENIKADTAFSAWEETIQPAQLERAILSLLEFGQIHAARQLQQKLSPINVPSELVIVDAALKLASISSGSNTEVSLSMLGPNICSVIDPFIVPNCNQVIDQVQTLELLAMKCSEGCGRGLCKRIIAVLKSAKALGIPFTEAFEKRSVELLQLLTLKAQECLDEARLLVQTHAMSPSNIACILAESFLKGLLAAYRGGYIESQREEGPAPLLWRFSDFLKWAELCPSEPEVGHALTRLVMTGQEIPHACEVELLILAHHFYKSSSCLGGVDVLITLAANRVESYVSEGDFSCLARLVTGVGNFHALRFILNILIENGQLELLLHKYSAADSSSNRTESVRGFRMAVLTALRQFDPYDLDAVSMVYDHFDMKYEKTSLLETRSKLALQKWGSQCNRDQINDDLLDSMGYLIEAAEVYSTIDAGQKTHKACAQAHLISLQVRIPDIQWLDLSDTNARRLLSEQTRFQEALIVAEAYGLNKPGEWAPVLWNLMLNSGLVEQFMEEFVSVLPLQPSMLMELAKFYRSEVTARGEASHFGWLSTGGMSSEWVKNLAKSFRSLLKRTGDIRVRTQLATIATGFDDVISSCAIVLDKVPDNSGPLMVRRGHGGAYMPLS